LKPKGFLLLAVIEPGEGDASRAAMARFRAAVWGGEALGVAGGQALMKRAGFDDVRVVAQPSGFVAFVVGTSAG
jgi:hypothetical protein